MAINIINKSEHNISVQLCLSKTGLNSISFIEVSDFFPCTLFFFRHFNF